MKPIALVPVAALIIGLIVANLLARPHDFDARLSSYTTSLNGRKSAQRHNAQRAARALDGTIIGPGKTFSFNGVVKGWDSDIGYVRAPVSVEGALVPAIGGGVCQTSTTLYNAALLAGLTVVERHPHAILPKYVPPGRDAAVAYPGVDLRIHNSSSSPVKLAATVEGDRLQIAVWGREAPHESIQLESRVLSITEPARRSRTAGPGVRRLAGSAGCRVVTYLVQGKHRRRLADDLYPAVDSFIPVP